MSLVIGDLSIRLVLNNPTLNGKHWWPPKPQDLHHL